MDKNNEAVRKLAKLIKQQRKNLGLNAESQQELLRRIRNASNLSNEELAEALGINAHTLNAYLAPQTAKKHRSMPEADRLVLSRIMAMKGRK